MWSLVSFWWLWFSVSLPSDGEGYEAYGSFLMGETDWEGDWVLFWCAWPCSVNLKSAFLLMGGAVFPPCYLTRRPNYGEGNEDNGDLLLKVPRAHCHTQCPDLAAGHLRLTTPLETPGHSQACLGQSLVGSSLLSPGFWCTQGIVSALQETLSPVLCKFYNQIPLASKVKFSGSSQSLCQNPRLDSQQCGS